MNILFVDYEYKKPNLKFGFRIIRSKFNLNIYCLYITNKLTKLDTFILRIYLSIKFKKKNIYIVTSKCIDASNLAIDEFLYNKNKLGQDNNITLVTGQNNLLINDKIYIDEYIEKNNLKREEIKVVVIIDKLDAVLMSKIEEFVLTFKYVDVYPVKNIVNLYNFISNLNNRLGSVIEILDKLENRDYNILLVFCSEHKISQTKSSYILDYNNNELDTKSNSYLIYQNNKNYYDEVFESLDTNVSRFDKTKLGKLYILTSGIILDK